ncbi:MAG: tRNA (adenosine(37)-N6)-dimethylallyltransferase MiaA [Bacteroidia bacterium]
MSSKPQLIVVMGPTASGKTAYAIDLAKKHNAEIFSADSRQFYREMNIGVAKPSNEELLAAKHHFVGHISIHDEYTAGDFEKNALNKLNEYFRTREVAILVGGSGLFIKAVLEGLDNFPKVDDKIRDELNQRLNKEGLESLKHELAKLDPESFNTIALDNPRRVIRALEVCLSSGEPYSKFKNQTKAPRGFSIKKIGLKWEREVLYQRINNRVDAMIAAGLEKEARSLFAYRHLNPLNTVGYSELFEYFDGRCTRAFAIEKIKQHTRNYAKRQLTWLRKEEGVEIVKV